MMMSPFITILVFYCLKTYNNLDSPDQLFAVNFKQGLLNMVCIILMMKVSGCSLNTTLKAERKLYVHLKIVQCWLGVFLCEKMMTIMPHLADVGD